MNIGINAQLATAARAGIGNYIFYLVRALSRIDTSNQYSLFVNSECRLEIEASQNLRLHSASLVSNSSWARILWEQLILPRTLEAAGVDIMHFPDYALPVMYNTRPWIITVHDLAFKLFPETFSRGKLAAKLMLIGPSLKKAHKIIADSFNTQRDLINLYQVPVEKIEVVHIGVDMDLFKPLDPALVREKLIEKYGLESGYILYVGTLEPRKNITSLIRAFKTLKERYNIPHKLVIAGSKGWLYEGIFRLVRESNLTEAVSFTGYVPAQDLPLLYNGADVFVFPSLYEGFGLPPLEAMACGTPVVTSNTSSLPEVVGDAGLMTDPLDICALSEAIYQIINDRRFSAELTVKGLDQARKFTWEETARKTLAVYEEVYNDAGKRR